MDRQPESPANGEALQECLEELASECEHESSAQHFVQELRGATYGIRARQGEVGISRKLVRHIFVDFVWCVMGGPYREQQRRLRMERGRRTNWDNTYSVGASLSGADSRGRAVRFRASVCTVTGEDGFAWGMYLAPNDTQMVPLAIFCGLHEAELPPDLASMPYLELLRMDVEAGGHLGHFPYIYTTDKSEADKNLWRRHAVQVVAAWRDRGCQIMSPFGAHCNSTV
jgi:hypothetical protein